MTKAGENIKSIIPDAIKDSKILSKTSGILGKGLNFVGEVADKVITPGVIAWNEGKQIYKDINNKNLTTDERIDNVLGGAVKGISDVTLGTIDFATGLFSDLTGINARTHLNEKVKAKDVSNILTNTWDKWKDFFETGSFNSGKAERERKQWHLNKEWEMYQRTDPNAFGVTHDPVYFKTKDKVFFKAPKNIMYGYDKKNKVWIIGGKAIPNKIIAHQIIEGLDKGKNESKTLRNLPNYSDFIKHKISGTYSKIILSNPKYLTNGKLNAEGIKKVSFFEKKGLINKADAMTLKQYYEPQKILKNTVIPNLKNSEKKLNTIKANIQKENVSVPKIQNEENQKENKNTNPITYIDKGSNITQIINQNVDTESLIFGIL